MEKYYLINEPFRYLKYQYSQGVVMFRNIYPIGINHEALEILRLCDGTKSDEEIIENIALLYSDEKNVSTYVKDFLDYSTKNGIVSLIDKRKEIQSDIYVSGSKEYWTPMHIVLEMTHKCLLRCKHCFISAGDGMTMPSKLIIELADEIVRLGVKSVQMTGGEPLIHPQFCEVLRKLVMGKTQVNITTSGYYLTDEILQNLTEIKKVNGYVQVSLDGMKEYHNKIRGREDAFERTITFIKRAIDLEIRVNVAFCYMGQKYGEIEELCRLIKELGVSEMKFGVVENKGRAKRNSINTEIDNYRTVKQYIVELQRKYQDDKFLVGQEETFDCEKAEFKNCGCGYNIIKINPEGQVFDCVFSDKAIGKIDEGKKLVNYLIQNADIIYNRTQKVAPCKEICGECEELIRCKGCLVKGREAKCNKAHFFE